MKKKTKTKIVKDCETCGSYLNKRVSKICDEINDNLAPCMCDIAKRIYALEQEIEFYRKIIKIDDYLLSNEEVFRNRRIKIISKQFKDLNPILRRMRQNENRR